MTVDWDPDRYARFKQERAQPFFDLLALLRPAPQASIIDLGCGTGELTTELHTRVGARSTVGVDRSPAMLQRAQASPGLHFVQRDLNDLPAERFEIVFSNAALHWVDDHPNYFKRVFALVAPGGQLAVQMPYNHDYPTHRVAAEVASTSPFREALGGYVRQSPLLAPYEYATLLSDAGFSDQHVLLRVYPHVLTDREHVIDWVRGTLLTDYQSRLSPDEFALFLDRYRARLFSELPDRRPFFYPFQRLLLWAARPS